MRRKRERKTRKIKQKPARSLMREADRVFSLWIRKRDKYRCVVCGSTERIQNSHLIKRGRHSVRFSEVNCSANCSSCNYRHNHNPEHYTRWFLDVYGQDAYGKLVEESRRVKKWTPQELTELIQRYS